MPISQIDPNLIRPNASAGSAAIEPDAIDMLIATVNQIIDEVIADISGTTNRLAKFSSATTIGDSSITDTGSLVTITGNLDVNGDVTKFGTISGDGASYFYAETLNFGYAQAGTFAGWINYNGLSNGSTQFRDLNIGDGKNSPLAIFTGSTKGLAVMGPLSTDGNLTALGNVALGNAGSDLIGFYGVAGVARATGIGALTDNSGGTANDTLEAISAAYVQSEVRNNFADLAAKVNAIRTVLLNLGLLTA